MPFRPVYNVIRTDTHALDTDTQVSSQRSSISIAGDISPIIASMDMTQYCLDPPRSPIERVQLGKRKPNSFPRIDSPERSPKKQALARSNTDIPIIGDEYNPFYVSPPHAPVIIAHSDTHQAIFSSLNIRFGVQYEIARFVSTGVLKYQDVTRSLRPLAGSNAVSAPITPKILGIRNSEPMNPEHTHAFEKEHAAKCPWGELDTEEQNLAVDPFAGLGFSEKFPEWYGGRVQFRARLSQDFKILLERAELGPSYRFARRFGSSSFLRVKIPNALLKKKEEALIAFFSRPFILNGAVFRAFFAKDEKVFLFRTNERFSRSQIFTDPNSDSMSLLDFLNWHNPLEYNRGKPLTKWASRFTLGLSTSVPGFKLAPEDIRHEDDIISKTTKAEMTDGCGYINLFPLRILQARYDWESLPSAIQCRIEGSKGLLMLPDRRDDDQVVPIVRIRPSQVKIKYAPHVPRDPAMLVLDLLVHARLTTPVRLSHEVLVNLWENGVPCEVFGALFVAGLGELVRGFVSWDDPFELWRVIALRSGVMGMRIARDSGTESRARGHREREFADGEEGDDEDGLRVVERAVQERSSAWWWDEVSGCPSKLEETVLVMLDAGFVPETCFVLREKLKKVITRGIKAYQRSAKVEVPMSCSAMIVPDPLGVLGPREVQIRSSRRNLKNADGLETDIVLGDVLLTRNPCKLPTDVQKFRAVDRPELRHLEDVIVCSVQGDRRQADLLAGGDYDGDRAFAIWQLEIVNNFRNADMAHSVQPDSINAMFYENPRTVDDFLQDMAGKSAGDIVRELQKFLLGALRDTQLVSEYSRLHENAVYKLGLDNKTTMELGWCFCQVLDATKSGLRLKGDVLRRHRDWDQTRGPEWKERVEDKNKSEKIREDNRKVLKRSSTKRRFVMDEITQLATEKADQELKLVEEKFRKFKTQAVIDGDLTAPWVRMCEIAQQFVEKEGNDRLVRDMKAIEDHVKQMRVEHRGQITMRGPESPVSPRKSPRKESNSALFTELPIQDRQDRIREMSQKFASRPGPDEVLMDENEIRRLRASYAYVHDTDIAKLQWGEGTQFPFDVAMRELCAIKARALGPSKTVTSSFYERFYLK